MKNFKSFAALFLIILTFSCNPINSERDLSVRTLSAPNLKADEEVAAEDKPGSGSDQIQNNVISNKKKIIKDGDISIKTNDLLKSKKNIDELAKNLDAYSDTEELTNEDYKISYNLKLRIPSDNFEKFISALESGKDEIKSKRINSRDVTEEYVDIEARLNNKRDYLKRYKELLTKASTIKDIVEIEENIRKLQEEIESKEGRLKYLNDQISYSTLVINLYKTKDFVYKPEQQDNFFERVKTSLNGGWTSVVGFSLWLIGIWPFIIMIIVAVFIVKRVKSKRKK